jgi:hypoxanthine phosphoribosyltransferase
MKKMIEWELVGIVVSIIVSIIVSTIGALPWLYSIPIVLIFIGIIIVIKFPRKRIKPSTSRVKKIVKEELSRDIKRFSPDIIIGIAGGRIVGGAVVASFIASDKIGIGSSVEKSIEVLYLEYPRRNEWVDWEGDWEEVDEAIDADISKIERKFQKEKKLNILIVDDISHRGRTIYETMTKLEKRLKEKEFNNFDIRVALIALKETSFRELEKNKTDFWKNQFVGFKGSIEEIAIEDDKEMIFDWKS